MQYTNLSDQIVFLRDADIIQNLNRTTISNNTVLSNGIPSYDLFLSTYNLLLSNITSVQTSAYQISNDVNGRLLELSNVLSTYSNIICSDISNCIDSNRTADKAELSNVLSTYSNNQINSLSNTTNSTFVHLSGDIINGNLSINGELSINNTLRVNKPTYVNDLEIHGKIRSSGGQISFGYIDTDELSDKQTFVWNPQLLSMDNEEYIGPKPIYKDHGNLTFNINPLSGINGIYIGEETLSNILSNIIECSAASTYISVNNTLNTQLTTLSTTIDANRVLDYISVDNNVQQKVSNLSSLLSNYIKNAGYSVISNATFNYDRKNHALKLSLRDQNNQVCTLTVDSTEFIKQRVVDKVELTTISTANDPKLSVLNIHWLLSVDNNQNRITTYTSIPLTALAQVYKAGNGIKLDDDLTINVLNYNVLTSNIENNTNDITKLTNNLSTTKEYLLSSIRGLSNFKGTLRMNKYDPDWVKNGDNTISAFINYTINPASDKPLRCGDIYEIEFAELSDSNSAFTFSNPLYAADQFYDTADGVRLAHKCFIQIYSADGNVTIPLSKITKDNIKVFCNDWYVPYQLNTINNYEQIWLSGNNNESAIYNVSVYTNDNSPRISTLTGHSIGGNNYFKDGNNYFDGFNKILSLSTHDISSELLSVYELNVKNKLSVETEVDLLSSNFKITSSLISTAYKTQINNDLVIRDNAYILSNAEINNILSVKNALIITNTLSTNNNTLSVENLSSGTMSVDWSHVIDPTTQYTLADLSTALSNKIYIEDRVDESKSALCGTSDLSILKMKKEDFDALVATNLDTMSSNILYVVDSDYIDAYGEQLCNLTMPEDNIPTVATNKHYVDSLCSNLSTDISVLSNNLSTDISTLSNNLSTDISVIYNAFNTLYSTISSIDMSSQLSDIISAVISIKNAISVF